MSEKTNSDPPNPLIPLAGKIKNKKNLQAYT
jgi:hypothetical protein